MKFNHALLALDLSESSDDLVHCVGDLKDLGIEQVTLLTVISNPYPGGPEKFDTSSMEEKLKNYASKVKNQGFQTDYKLKIESGTYAPVTILKEAKNLSADLLILGHRGHNRMAELILGSVASEILQRANMPVLLLRISDQPGNNAVSICKSLTKNFLIATDFSDNADKMLSLFENQQLKSSNVTLLYVRTSSAVKNESEKLENRADKLRKKGVDKIDTKILEGHVALQIENFANKNNNTLIIMGAQGKGFVEQLFIGSNSLRVARLTSKPLLLIPARN
ncbi:MAG TPA: universal stress protein [Balneolaceae bacterium]|nr:universal stress protein [Balneolaceae bacterium]